MYEKSKESGEISTCGGVWLVPLVINKKKKGSPSRETRLETINASTSPSF